MSGGHFFGDLKSRIRTSEGTPCDEGVVGQLGCWPILNAGDIWAKRSSVVDGWLKPVTLALF